MGFHLNEGPTGIQPWLSAVKEHCRVAKARRFLGQGGRNIVSLPGHCHPCHHLCTSTPPRAQKGSKPPSFIYLKNYCKVVFQCNKICSYTIKYAAYRKVAVPGWHEPICLRLKTNSPQRTMKPEPAQSRLCRNRLLSL